jgi:uncharacterized linocin/CFP29 family protein
MTPAEREALIEQVVGAHRERDAEGRPRAHPAWHDLDEDARREAFEQTLIGRRLEAVLDPEGRSSTVKAVLGRIRG